MDRVRGEKLVFQQDPGFGPGSEEDPVPLIRDAMLPTSSGPCALYPKEETQQVLSPMQAPSQTLDPKPEATCCRHSLPGADLQWSTDPAPVKRELWGLQATNKEVHLAKDETFWKRKSRARKSLFQRNPMSRTVKSSELSIIQQSQEQPALHQSLTQQLQDTCDLEEVRGLGARERLAEKGSGFLPFGKGNPGSLSSPDIPILDLHSETFGNRLIEKEKDKWA